jgi:3-oxoacyl-[acyl-carrier protein] reductase
LVPLEAVTERELHRQFGVNALGPILATQRAVKRFGDQGGSVTNVSSVASEKAMPNATGYAATTSALDSVGRSHAVELAARGIRVNAIAPGASRPKARMRPA